MSNNENNIEKQSPQNFHQLLLNSNVRNLSATGKYEGFCLRFPKRCSHLNERNVLKIRKPCSCNSYDGSFLKTVNEIAKLLYLLKTVVKRNPRMFFSRCRQQPSLNMGSFLFVCRFCSFETAQYGPYVHHCATNNGRRTMADTIHNLVNKADLVT